MTTTLLFFVYQRKKNFMSQSIISSNNFFFNVTLLLMFFKNFLKFSCSSGIYNPVSPRGPTPSWFGLRTLYSFWSFRLRSVPLSLNLRWKVSFVFNSLTFLYVFPNYFPLSFPPPNPHLSLS